MKSRIYVRVANPERLQETAPSRAPAQTEDRVERLNARGMDIYANEKLTMSRAR